MAEMQYSARSGSGASFTFAVNRNGTVVQGLHPETQTPWTNGDLNQPIHPVTQAMVGSPFNANEFCFMTAENVGYNPGSPITDQQIEADARLAAWGSRISGLPVNRDTVLGHRYFNSVGRWNCPTPGDIAVFLDRIIARANEILAPTPQEINMRMREKYEEWNVVEGAKFYSNGPGIGEPLTFSVAGKLVTTSEEILADGGSGKWRTFRRPFVGETAWVHRSSITPFVAGGDPAFDASVKATLERKDEASDLRIQVGTLSERLRKKDLVLDAIDKNVAIQVASGKAI